MTSNEDLSAPDVLQKANNMRKKMQQLEQELNKLNISRVYEGIQVCMSGEGELISIILDPEKQNLVFEKIQKDLIIAINNTKKAVEQEKQNSLLSILDDI